MQITVSARIVPHETDDSLIGRKWQAPDGVATITDERTPGGLYIVIRGDGRRQGIRASILRDALERSEVMA
jgi:hypothetical protein